MNQQGKNGQKQTRNLKKRTQEVSGLEAPRQHADARVHLPHPHTRTQRGGAQDVLQGQSEWLRAAQRQRAHKMRVNEKEGKVYTSARTDENNRRRDTGIVMSLKAVEKNGREWGRRQCAHKHTEKIPCTCVGMRGTAHHIALFRRVHSGSTARVRLLWNLGV